MSRYTIVCFMIFGYFFSSSIVQNKSKKLDGYKSPVYTTLFCPRNESEWNNRSSALNCNKTNGYTCLPNEKFTELLEFCYTAPFIWIQEGVCLYLKRKGLYVDAFNCKNFTDGCPNTSYQSIKIFEHAACISIGNGCFLAEQSCKNSPNANLRPETTDYDKDDWHWVVIVIGIIVFISCILSFMLYFYHKRKKCLSRKRGSDIERTLIELEERSFLITNNDNEMDSPNEICKGCILLDELKEKKSSHTDTETKEKDSSYNESSSCKRGNDIEGTLNEFEDRKILITDTENVKNDFSTELSAYQRCIGVKGQDDLEEKESFTSNIGTDKKDFSYEESTIEKAIFNQWKQDDFCFISTKACKDVEKKIKSRNLVIVTGHSGSGKSAIIQHIALKYREQGWTVKRVKKVEDIVSEYSSSRFQKDKTICVFNDPFGKESLDEILNNPWQTYEEELKLYLKTAKLIMSCRNHIISDTRLTRFTVYQSHIVDIDDNKNRLTVDEKQQILRTYKIDMNFSDKDCDKIVEVETYFPLLCKLYSNKEDYEEKGIKFFIEPVTVLTEEILGFRTKDKGKYCALALLVVFHNDICVSDLLKDSDMEDKFKYTLKLCGLPNNTEPAAIIDSLNTLKGCFVKNIKDTYQFNHDFVMEVTTQVFGKYYPAEMIKYADTGFLRRRVRLEDCEIHNDPFNIYLTERYIEKLGERLFNELFEERFLDTVLNPCLRHEKVIEVLKKKIASNPPKIRMFLKRKKVIIDKQEVGHTSKNLLLTKHSFLGLENEISPLFALIVFCHTQISQYCLNILQQIHRSFKRNCFALMSTKLFYKQKKRDVLTCYFFAMCCNGSKELFNTVFKDQTKEFLSKPWGVLFPFHIVAVFHNYQLLFEMIKIGVDVNLKTKGKDGWTPLILAAGNDTQEYGGYNYGESGATRRDKTVKLLLSKGADINLCMMNKASPLYIACQNGHDSTVQLLLSNGADINLCYKNGVSPLFKACKNGHDSTVQLLLSKGADINLCNENGVSPLFKACENGHDSTVQLLLSKEADINLCNENGVSPLYIACQNGHDSTVQLLLSKGADITLCNENGVSPLYIACQNGHDSIVQLLLRKGADINLCNENGVSPLYIACQNGDDSTVQLLLRKGADINLCNENGVSPLFIACENGHDSTVQLLLSKGADINLCMKNGVSPFLMACHNGHDSTVQILLSKGADINLCNENGVSPLYIAFFRRHYNTVNILLKRNADTSLSSGLNPTYLDLFDKNDSTINFLLQKDNIYNNIYDPDSYFSLFVFCHVEKLSRELFGKVSY